MSTHSTRPFIPGIGRSELEDLLTEALDMRDAAEAKVAALVAEIASAKVTIKVARANALADAVGMLRQRAEDSLDDSLRRAIHYSADLVGELRRVDSGETPS
jgi:hypothetical protein